MSAAKTFVDWQVAQLQRLIGEKDMQISDVKAKSRDLQVTACLLMASGQVVRVHHRGHRRRRCCCRRRSKSAGRHNKDQPQSPIAACPALNLVGSFVNDLSALIDLRGEDRVVDTFWGPSDFVRRVASEENECKELTWRMNVVLASGLAGATAQGLGRRYRVEVAYTRLR
jgi:hypothetical protein